MTYWVIAVAISPLVLAAFVELGYFIMSKIKDFVLTSPEKGIAHPTGDESTTITLVHGTYARHTAWIRPSSRLFRALKRDSAYVTPFLWSGHNFCVSRHNAALRLRCHLSELAKKCPKARHYVVGHSHGGTIAVDAGHLSNAGIVCLSTPFIHMTDRQYPIDAKNDPPDWLFIASLGCLMLSLTFLALWDEGGRAAAFMFAGSLLFIALISCGIVWLCHWLSERIGSTRLIGTDRLPLLIIRTSYDEATGVLVASQFGAWLADHLWKIVTIVYGLFQQVGDAGIFVSTSLFGGSQEFRLTLGFLFCCLLTVIGLGLADTGHPTLGLFLWSPLAVLATAYVARKFLSRSVRVTWGPLVMIIAGITLVPFGCDALLLAPFLVFGSDSSPIGGPFAIITYPAWTGGLSHCQVYDHPDAIEKIKEFCFQAHENDSSDGPRNEK